MAYEKPSVNVINSVANVSACSSKYCEGYCSSTNCGKYCTSCYSC